MRCWCERGPFLASTRNVKHREVTGLCSVCDTTALDGAERALELDTIGDEFVKDVARTAKKPACARRANRTSETMS